MLTRRRLIKKVAGQIAIGLVFLIFFALVYFLSRAYFEQYLLVSKQASSFSVNNISHLVTSVDAQPSDENFVATTSVMIEKINNQIISFYNFFFNLQDLSSSVANSGDPEPAGTTYLGSFPYTSATVDYSKTNLRFDSISNSISFAPNYTWENASPSLIEANQSKFGNHQENLFSGPYNDKRCLGNNCLELRNNKLFYNNQLVALPDGIKSSSLQAISLGTVASRWLVGLTIKDSGYRGEVFYFDGSKFFKVTNFSPVISKYFGLFGFGGDDSDFMIVYGAYQGQAFRVQGNMITNLDKFFSYRPMNNGFKTEIIKAKNTWYIYSSTTNNPKFIKLWEDSSGTIVGALSLGGDLQLSGAAEFNLIKTDSNSLTLLARLKNKESETWKVFTDSGFLNNKAGVLVTLPTPHDALNSQIFINKIYESELGVDKEGQNSVKMEFSVDGLKWQNLPQGQNLDFKQAGTKYYFLRLNFAPVQESFYSPFVDKIIFSYTCHI
ncbi:MAG: hypothetical protein WCK59_04030 [Candidatus Falkowbacteria bacterium]